MRIRKVSDFVNILSNKNNFKLDFTAAKVVQVAQRVLVTTAIALILSCK